MDKAPLVSIVIPTYKRAHLIGRAIQSVLPQTYKDWDLWVVDDNSGDDTERVVSAFKDARIRYVQHPANRGAAAARNTGIHASRGEYLAFLDSDDEWVSTKLEKQLALFQNGSKDLGLVYSAYKRVQDGSETIWNPTLAGFVHEKILLEGCEAGTSNFMVPRNVLVSVGGFDEILPPFEDYDLVIRISKNYAVDFLKEPEVIVHQASHEDRLSNNLKRQTSAFALLFQKHLAELKRDRRTYATWLTAAGDLCFRNGDLKKGRSYYWKSLGLSPFQPTRLAHAALSYHPRLHQIFFSFWRQAYWNMFNRKHSASSEYK